MSKQDAPAIAAFKPCLVVLEKGRRYAWCACGKSDSQPFCDGSHKGTGIEPLPFAAEESGEALLCACKRTATAPFCDGSHNDIPGAYQEDDPLSDENRKIALVARGAGPTTKLDGNCFVFQKSKAQMETRETIRHTRVISPAQGARYQSQFYLELECGLSPAIGCGDRNMILFFVEGAGRLLIGSRAFEFSGNAGACVRPGETFRIEARKNAKLFVSVCPAAERLSFPDGACDAFDPSFPERIVRVDPDERTAMASRYFQILADKNIGSTKVTQFIGHIPRSKAEPHRHLYEESLIILSGKGAMWTDAKKTAVEAGDVIFLPAKQRHCLECADDAGMDVLGVIYPGDNPAINY